MTATRDNRTTSSTERGPSIGPADMWDRSAARRPRNAWTALLYATTTLTSAVGLLTPSPVVFAQPVQVRRSAAAPYVLSSDDADGQTGTTANPGFNRTAANPIAAGLVPRNDVPVPESGRGGQGGEIDVLLTGDVVTIAGAPAAGTGSTIAPGWPGSHDENEWHGCTPYVRTPREGPGVRRMATLGGSAEIITAPRPKVAGPVSVRSTPSASARARWVGSRSPTCGSTRATFAPSASATAR